MRLCLTGGKHLRHDGVSTAWAALSLAGIWQELGIWDLDGFKSQSVTDIETEQVTSVVRTISHLKGRVKKASSFLGCSKDPVY